MLKEKNWSCLLLPSSSSSLISCRGVKNRSGISCRSNSLILCLSSLWIPTGKSNQLTFVRKGFKLTFTILYSQTKFIKHVRAGLLYQVYIYCFIQTKINHLTFVRASFHFTVLKVRQNLLNICQSKFSLSNFH